MESRPPTDPPRRLSPVQILLAVALVVSGFFAVGPLQDAATGAGVPYAELTQPAAYLVMAPLFGVWDALSLLTLSQHYAVLSTLAALYVAWRTRAPRSERPWLHRVGIEIVRAFASIVALLLFYVAGLLLPRPMVGIELSEQELVAIDFHSHTAYSHDGWSLFSVDRNRAWHEQGGFDVAYITDHYTWRGFDEGAPDNPDRAGAGLVLLEGAELRIHQRPTNALGHRSRYLPSLTPDSIYMEPDTLRVLQARGGRPATLLYTMPGHLQYVVPFDENEASGVIGIELNDGSPRGLEQVRGQRAEILALADSADLAVIGAANLHGWGRTVASWSVMTIPGWRQSTPDELATEIERQLHSLRRDAVTVVERRMPYHDGSSVRIALTLPWLTWEYFRMMSLGERASWLSWIGLFAAISAIRRRRHPVEGASEPEPTSS